MLVMVMVRTAGHSRTRRMAASAQRHHRRLVRPRRRLASPPAARQQPNTVRHSHPLLPQAASESWFTLPGAAHHILMFAVIRYGVGGTTGDVFGRLVRCIAAACSVRARSREE